MHIFSNLAHQYLVNNAPLQEIQNDKKKDHKIVISLEYQDF